MNVLEINTRANFQWPILPTVLASWKINKILELIQNIKKKHNKNTNKTLKKLAGSLQHAFVGIPGGVGLFSHIRVALAGTSQWL